MSVSRKLLQIKSKFCSFINIFFRKFRTWVKSYRFLIKPTLIFAAIILIALSAVIRANFNYIDDLKRVDVGMQNWGGGFSRYLSDFLSSFIHTDSSLADISPLTQIIAALLMGLACAITVHVITGAKKYKIHHYIATIPVGLAPYFLECYSYKFDAPYMALSVLASVLPFLFWQNKSRTSFYITSFLSALVVCMTYQASNGLFFILLTLLCLKEFLETEKSHKIFEIIKSLILAALPFFAGMLIFKLFLMKPYDDYVSNELPSLLEMPITFLRHLKDYYAIIWLDFNIAWKILIALVLLIFVILAAVKSKRNKLFSLAAICIFLLIVAAGSFGAYPLLKQPLTDPRGMYGITVAFGFICVYASSLATGRGANLIRLPIYAIAWCFFVFSFIYGNALSTQLEYANFRMEQTISALNQNDIITKNTKNIRIEGYVDHAPALRERIGHFPLLGRLVPKVYYGGGHVWGQYKFFNYYGLDASLYNRAYIQNLDETKVIETLYETIQYTDEEIYITLKNNQ